METIDLWPNATVPICRTVHKFGEKHREIVGITCYRCCSVGLGYALPGSDVDGITLLVDTQVDTEQIMGDLESALAEIGSPFVKEDAVILNYKDAIRKLDSLGPEYDQPFTISEHAGKTFNGVEYDKIEKEREPIRKLIDSIPPLALRLSRFYRDACLYARDVIPHRPVPEFIRGYCIAGERSTLEMKHPKTKKVEIRKLLFSQWESLSPIEKQIVKSLHQNGNGVSSIRPELISVLESFVNRGLMTRLPRHLNWRPKTLVYAQLWTNGHIKCGWEEDDEESVRIWRRRTKDYDFELANKLNGTKPSSP